MRTFDRILSLILGLAGLAFGILVIAEVIAAVLGRPVLALPYSSAARFLRGHPWSAGPVITIAAVLLGVGLLLLIAELKPRRRTHLVLRPLDPRVTATLPRSSVARVLEDAAGQTPGIARARASVSRRRARLHLHVAVRDAAEIARRAEGNARSALADLQLLRAPRLVVRRRKDTS
ncbi:MAG: hypothetical protein JWP46_4187 [Modestobacter sp.]|jgi:hypothetical protein|nr:hypothetical protein [Modestobacter sp.]